MDLAQVFIFDLGWLFFAAWATVLAAVSVVAFGRDIMPSAGGEEKIRKQDFESKILLHPLVKRSLSREGHEVATK
jgi:hypothetical protein